MKQSERLSFADIQTLSVHTRTNLVSIANMARPYADTAAVWNAPSGLAAWIDRLIALRVQGRPVIWSMGAHVIKNGLSRYVIELVRQGIVTHVSGNGATSIHDFELALLGETSEDVATAIEDGTFGMWEETGRYMNEAIEQGVAAGLGYGESLHAYVARHPDRFPYVEDCVFVQCQKFGIPYTCHISIGTDIIHQHPIVNFEALGEGSGRDFRTLCRSIREMDGGGMFLNFGSAISGPELFVRGMSLAINSGAKMSGILAANFDIVPVFDDQPTSPDEAAHYYRPRRAFMDDLHQWGGQGKLFQGLHQITIPYFFNEVLRRKQELGAVFAPPIQQSHAHNSSLFASSLRQCRVSVSGKRQSDSDIDPTTLIKEDQTWSPAGFSDFVQRLITARRQGRHTLVFLGGHVVGSGVVGDLCKLIRSGIITHLAMTGACAYQDYELAQTGEADDASPDSHLYGRRGMWQGVGEAYHRALATGYAMGLGWGDSLKADVQQQPARYPYVGDSLLGACLDLQIPYTVHTTFGTDDEHLHPDCDFGVLGGLSGRDFQSYAHTVAHLEDGVFMNYGSTVTGPEVFLKALSIARNLKYVVSKITTANFDMVKLGDYHRKVGYEDWDYYYRPRKNIIHRPTSLGGHGFHFEGLHEVTIPALYRALKQQNMV